MKRVFRNEELLRGSTEGREEIYKPRDAHGDTDKRQYEEQCVDDESQKQLFPDLFNRTLYGVELRVLLFELFENFLIHKKSMGNEEFTPCQAPPWLSRKGATDPMEGQR